MVVDEGNDLGATVLVLEIVALPLEPRACVSIGLATNEVVLEDAAVSMTDRVVVVVVGVSLLETGAEAVAPLVPTVVARDDAG